MTEAQAENLKQENIPILEENWTIWSFLVDPGKKLSIPSLFGLMVEIAHHDAGRRGWGYSEMIRRNQAWVFLRALIKVTRLPKWGEKITIRTWPKTMEGISATRDIQFIDDQGDVVVAATTVWSIIDLDTRKPVRLNGVEYNSGKLAQIHAVEEKPRKIQMTDNLQVSNRFAVTFNHSDMNLHVNNARYIDWILNEMPENILENMSCQSIEVNFSSELMVGNQAEVLVPGSTETQEFTGFIRNAETGQNAFAMKFTF
jgi:acyl-ACP thioesterase